MLLGFALVTMASAYGLKSVMSDTKTFILQKELKERGPLDVERDFDLICMICRIRRVSYPSLIGGKDTEVLPENGVDRAYEFIMQEPLTDISDFDKFCEVYHGIRRQELMKRQETWNNEYEEIVNSLNLTNEVTTFKKMVVGISMEDSELIEKMYVETILGEIALKKGKAVFQYQMSGRLHVWALRGVRYSDAEKLYKACARKCGIDMY